jgi:hypothetical protein
MSTLYLLIPGQPLASCTHCGQLLACEQQAHRLHWHIQSTSVMVWRCLLSTNQGPMMLLSVGVEEDRYRGYRNAVAPVTDSAFHRQVAGPAPRWASWPSVYCLSEEHRTCVLAAVLLCLLFAIRCRRSAAPSPSRVRPVCPADLEEAREMLQRSRRLLQAPSDFANVSTRNTPGCSSSQPSSVAVPTQLAPTCLGLPSPSGIAKHPCMLRLTRCSRQSVGNQ